jgi:hypothetical protein
MAKGPAAIAFSKAKAAGARFSSRDASSQGAHPAQVSRSAKGSRQSMTSDINHHNDDTRPHGGVLFKLVQEEARALGGWALLIGAALIGLFLSEGSELHQLSIGVLLASVSLFVTMALFEVAWRAVMD